MTLTNKHRPTKATINLGIIQENIQWIKKQIHPQQNVYATVKANAYGHGLIPVAKVAIEAGADGLAVATVDEGVALRQAKLADCPILVMGLTSPKGIIEILQNNLTITVSDSSFFLEAEKHLAYSDKKDRFMTNPLSVHLAIDTGMSRIGLRTIEEIEEFSKEISHYSWVHWCGAFTHFATAGGGPVEYVKVQWDKWLELQKALPDTVTERHYANSAMAMWFNDREPLSTIVRLGIGMYGLNPKDLLPEDQEIEDIYLPSINQLKPALQLTSEIVHVKKVPSGTAISYGATYKTKNEEWIATVPIGYGDGWLRHYQTVPVLVDGQSAPIVGVINMDQMMIRLPKYYPIGTTVTLIGNDGLLDNHPSKIAREVGTIGYEVLTAINTRVAREYVW